MKLDTLNLTKPAKCTVEVERMTSPRGNPWLVTIGHGSNGRCSGNAIHWIETGLQKTLCGKQACGVYNADLTELARNGEGLISLVSCLHCGGKRENLGKIDRVSQELRSLKEQA